LTLDDLRRRFWWLGGGEAGSHLVALANNRVTMEITQHTWSRRTERYERSVEEGLAAMGLRVEWRRAWSAARRRDLDEARTRAEAAGQRFDEEAFVEERARFESEAGQQE
jgi:hypothetical protein